MKIDSSYSILLSSIWIFLNFDWNQFHFRNIIFSIKKNYSIAFILAFWIISFLFLIKSLRASNSALGKLISINLLVSFYDRNAESRNLALIQSKSKLEIFNEFTSLYNNSNGNK